MKRILSLLLVMLLCCMMVLPVSAADGFVPSISYKDHPEVEGDPELIDKDGETVQELDGDCLKITPVSDAIDTPEAQRSDAEKLLIEVYEKLSDGSMKLPFAGDDADKMVIRDLIDASLICGDYHADPSHVDELAKPGVFIEITFDLGVDPDTNVVVMAYIDGEWTPIESVKNNGDGTVTCVFEEICPIAFCVEADAAYASPYTGDTIGDGLVFWAVLMAVSMVAIVILLVRFRKSNR